MKSFLITLFALVSVTLTAQPSKPAVLTLGSFHFNFPNLDVKQISRQDQIDVLEPRYQQEINLIVDKIARFRPTIIVIERQPDEQHRTDSTLGAYLAGNYSLKRKEEEQIGFRLAKRFGIHTVYCVDEWGTFTDRLDQIVFGRDSTEAKKFETYFEHNPDSLKRFRPAPVFKTQGILAELRQLNDEGNIKKSLGNYLTGLFKYESKEHDFTGVDFETGRWFSRNLKIFRNIQRIKTSATDRILVIFGAGHMNLLNFFFDCSPEYDRVPTNAYLK